MTDHTFPSDGDSNDAANFAQYLGQAGLGDYVETGFGFTVDYGVPEVDVAGGKAYVIANSMFADQAGVTRGKGVLILIEKDPETLALTDNDTNYIYIDANHDLTDTSSTDDQPRFVVNTTGTPPSDESIEIGTVDTSGNTKNETNRDKSVDADTVDGLDASQFLRSDVSDSFTGSDLDFSAASYINLPTVSSDPSSPGVGAFWYNTSED